MYELVVKPEQASAELGLPMLPGVHLEELPVSRLRALARHIGISRGDDSHVSLVANLTAFVNKGEGSWGL